MKRRETEIFSLSFLDCICCGFGAIILLFILSMGASRTKVDESREDLDKILMARQAALAELTSLKVKLTSELTAASLSLDAIITELAKLQALIDELKERIQQEQSGREALTTDVEQLKREVAATQKEPEVKQLDPTTPVGVPVDSNYVAFIIDTSGSMRDINTEALEPVVIQKFAEVLAAYPELKGVQFLDADGRFILGRTGTWIDDTPATRKAVLDAVRRYQIYSNSNPVPGMVRAMRTLYDAENKEMKMSVFVFGDEFADDPQGILDRFDRLNPKDEKGKRPVRIHGVGFPHLLTSAFSLGQSGVKFANLMRELTSRHGGAFIAVME
jgi:hypothetical protein